MTTHITNSNDLITCADGTLRPRWASRSQLCWDYYDNEWGRPPTSLYGVFELLTLVVFQVGVTWHAVLKKRDGFRHAFVLFNAPSVATFTDCDIARLLANPDIFRNRQKIQATIANAKALLALEKDGEDFISLIHQTSSSNTCLVKELKHRGFKYVGPTSLGIIQQATGVGRGEDS
ncbi:DNA-3-methyladenine glycosylase I protein [Corynebacterium deserti GIMN1.010]|uniref:DNA-3-methyladenine glycosylase I protein n=1 Tax=Corynebacterium deserti GIMN1.010 TaxID=931089 RepID=A0A0M3Q8W5_9CORY|nr:DNA-3-methyladenine glycosylase I [Corynebacterium deserti]ALC04659.1 DNA-3-methyladenine glycosylase I protein [Corynebacterium deserti GIMN1.010]